jgi:mono/diheme cytochrome c family protein
MFRRIAILILAIIALAAIGGAAYWAQLPRAVSRDEGLSRVGGQDFTQIERGRYLVTAADCAACHSGQGLAPFAGGRAIETPFGDVLASNITPDQETGIGAWSDDDFDAALRQGKRRDGKLLYPAMPFVYYTNFSRSDVLAIRAYLSTVDPVRHKVVADQLPFPFSVRASMHVWDTLYFNPRPYVANSAKSAQWNRGAYLVEGAGHCGACHTPKSWLGGEERSRRFQGSFLQGWFAPDLTGDKLRGLGTWSADDIVAYLRTGHNRFAAAAGPMAEEVERSSSRLRDADLLAIAAYLKDDGAGSAPSAPAPSNDPAMAAGGAIYRDVCSACHAIDGRGTPSLYPALAIAPSTYSINPASMIRVVLVGARSAATAAEPTAPAMPAFGWQLSDEQVAAVLTYVRNAWGKSASPVSADEVRRARVALVSPGQ